MGDHRKNPARDYSVQMVNVTKGGNARNRAQRAREREVCFELRLRGHSIRETAELASQELGWSISGPTAWRRIEEEGLLRVEPAEEALRAQELARLDRYLVALETAALSDDPKDKVAAVNSALKLQERRAKLLGLDAPQRAEVTVQELGEQDVELAAMIREEKARQARREEELAERREA